jgi:Omp85 superfamily domain
VRCLCKNLRRYRWALFLLSIQLLPPALFVRRSDAQEARTNQPPSSIQTTETPPSPSKPVEGDDNTSKKARAKRGAFLVAPLPISSPALGSGVVPVLAYIFPVSANDEASPASVAAAAGLVTDNGTRALALGGEIYFKQGNYHIAATYARGNLNYDLYGLGSGDSNSKLPLTQTGQVVSGEFLRRTLWKIFVGPRFLWGSSLITLRPSDGETTQLPPDIGLHTNLSAIGFRFNRDTVPNRFYPTEGMVLNFTADFFSQALGSKYSLQSYKINFNKYWLLSQNQVLASGSFACFTGGSPPFYGNCIYGTNNELRGYIAGRYLDRYLVGSQLEYRLALPKRFGIVGFGGLGEVLPGGPQPFRGNKFLPSGGAGARFELSKKYHVNLRIDFAQGKNSHTWSIGVGEAF